MRCGSFLLLLWLACFIPVGLASQSTPRTTYGTTHSSSQSSGKQSQSSQDLSNNLEASWETFDNLLNEQEKLTLTLKLGLEHTENLKEALSTNCADLRNYADELAADMKKRDTALMESYRDLERAEKKASRRLSLLLATWGIIAAFVAFKAMLWYIKKRTAVI